MDFYKRVALVCKSIPKGKVASYGQIALLCGKPKNARQVGYALGKKLDHDVPAYQVVNGQGYLSGAGAFDTALSQKKQLRKDGVVVSRENRVDLKKFGWYSTFDEAEEFRNIFEQEGI
ncbi:MAG TPA: MGMT family protein [Candidatus Merdenecus merdavium]|nr:MGMT family protein [Candidatus Merdenecus merdavium]